MTDFLLELRSEEIPARMQVKAKEDLARLFNDALAKAGLVAESVETFATPRRLALIAKGLPLATEAVAEETKGPKVGAPPQAMEGFLRKTGMTQDQLVERDGVYFAVVEKAGRNTADVLGEAIPAIIRAFPWPKSQRWGAASASTESLRWVRPLQGIVALLGDEVVPCEIDGIVSGAATMGHRFHHSGPITIGNAGDYIEKLRACHVIVHFSERCAIIRDGAKAAAEAAGLNLVEDEGLVAENAGLTEWPVPMLGRFDPAFLEVPEEVIQLTARVNQKYFVCHDAGGKLANAFVCTANIVANDNGAAIVAGNEKVLAARLSDAKFFWEQDLKGSIREKSKQLARVKFFDGLGTYEEKQYRVGFLMQELDQIVRKQGISISSGLWQAAELSKVDLVTGTVGEFPELQGVVGSYLVASDEYAGTAAGALKFLYSSSKEILDAGFSPDANVLQIADRIDSIVAFAAVGVWFKGSGDPYAIRQSAQALLAAILTSGIRVGYKWLISQAYHDLIMAMGMSRDVYAVERLVGSKGEIREIETPVHGAGIPDKKTTQIDEFTNHGFRAKPASIEGLYANNFYDDAIQHIQTYYKEELPWIAPLSEVLPKIELLLIDRLKVQQREAGVRHDLIDAVFALGGEDDLVRLLARVKALQAFVATDEGVNLLAGYKRAANIFKAADDVDAAAPAPADLVAEEAALLAALDTAEPKAAAAVDAEDFEGAMAALASLRAPIDAFFDGVMVNDPDPQKRAFRLGLLARFRDAVHRVADFSKIEG